MEIQRNFFIIVFLFISFFVWKAWKDQLSTNNYTNDQTNIKVNLKNNIKNNKNQIIIKNDVIRLVINLYGGNIEEASLINYKEKLNSLNSLKLLETSSNFIYQAQSGLVDQDALDGFSDSNRPLYISKKNFFESNNSNKALYVPIVFYKNNGVIYKKTFTLKPGRYDVGVKYSIDNSSNRNLKIRLFEQLKQTVNLPKNRDIYSKNFALQTFRGAAYSTSDAKYEKYKFEDISSNKNLNITMKSGWIAMLQQYFAVAWIPETNIYPYSNINCNTIYTSYSDNNTAIIGYKSPLITIPSHSHLSIKSKLWIGPEIQKDMALVAPNLDLTVDYGWLWFLSQPLFKLLSILHSIIGNWGFSIIAITFIMRAFTYPLTRAQYFSMAKMRGLQPKINAIKKNFNHDKQKMSQEIMALYKNEKINPLGGCLPVFIQMPIFLSLYYMLVSSVELRHAPFLLWINDLSDQDPYYILPIIMGLTMFFIQKTSPNNISDALQQKIMNFMPVVFTIFFLWFPSGLVLYYIVSNLVTIMQQKLILSNFNKKINYKK